MEKKGLASYEDVLPHTVCSVTHKEIVLIDVDFVFSLVIAGHFLSDDMWLTSPVTDEAYFPTVRLSRNTPEGCRGSMFSHSLMHNKLCAFSVGMKEGNDDSVVFQCIQEYEAVLFRPTTACT